MDNRDQDAEPHLHDPERQGEDEPCLPENPRGVELLDRDRRQLQNAADTNQRQLDERASPLPGGSSSCWKVGEQLWQSTAAPPWVELDRKSRWKDQQELARPAVRFSLYRSAWQHRFERRLHYQAHLTV